MSKSRSNCWEYMKCGREPGGSKTDEFGVCPAAINKRFHGVNRGEAAGRFCWYVSGTYCKGKVQGTYARKLRDCLQCEFYHTVELEEGRELVLTEEDVPQDL